ncbi:hypothetical protein CC1G_09857 [Coprinopsis cinerea okayama7|uniref:Uncharacterized protein n=1 Tax=Coprinopsis cinerea (strain Okayama-7 / 130 / ATCC MYA-4618 / FGSC 9003) TaxID=240176 RepID=A8P0F0_COPC7|nr:hypothetical protein CC1G_09857 [Coprinopsis cinerea okayama7\|eukprot:XP_001837875.1 hypothetical protein CC1G_09857 [Coprinopsis cinerea okayama7\
MSTQTESGPSSDAVMTPLEQYAAYRFDADDTYQQGLASILAGGALNNASSPEAKEEILRRTRVFYFNKMTGNSITMEDAREYELSVQAATTTPSTLEPSASTTEQSSSAPEETRVLTFAELKELIETGKVDQIPNNKIIPEKFSEEAPSQSTAPVRKKPWEMANPAIEVQQSS